MKEKIYKLKELAKLLNVFIRCLWYGDKTYKLVIFRFLNN